MAALDAWLVFEDEAGFSMTPPTTRTWSRRGHTPVVRVRGRSCRRLSVAALACYKTGESSRLIYRPCPDARPDGRKSFSWKDYRDLIQTAHQQLGGPIVLVWERYFNGTGWLAIFTGTETMIGRTVRVDAWDETTGVALVVDPERGTRRPVTDYPDFSHLEEADQVVAAIPGGGWRAYWKDEGPDNGPLTEQVLAWLVTSKGRATPITVDAHGHVDDAESADRLIPPGEE